MYRLARLLSIGWPRTRRAITRPFASDAAIQANEHNRVSRRANPLTLRRGNLGGGDDVWRFSSPHLLSEGAGPASARTRAASLREPDVRG